MAVQKGHLECEVDEQLEEDDRQEREVPGEGVSVLMSEGLEQWLAVSLESDRSKSE